MTLVVTLPVRGLLTPSPCPVLGALLHRPTDRCTLGVSLLQECPPTSPLTMVSPQKKPYYLYPACNRCVRGA